MRKLAFFLIFAAVIASAFAAGRTDSRDAAARRAERKADMMFLEALRHKEAGDIDAYADIVRRAFETNPADSFLGYEFGRLVLATSDDSASVENAYKLMRDYAVDGAGASDYTTVNIVLRAATGLNRHDDALLMLERLYSDNPDRPEVADQYAQALVSSGDSALAAHGMAVYDTLEIREGPSVTLAVRRFQSHLLLADTAAAIAVTQRMAADFPASAEAAIVAGDMFQYLAMPDSALERYNRALKLDPSSGQAYYNRANLYLQQNDSTAYNREIFLALEQPDLDVDTKMELMRDYVVKLFREPAQRPHIDALFNRLLELHPHEADIHGLYADYLAATGDYRHAAEQVQYQLDLDPSDIQRWSMLARLRFSAGDYPRAEAAVSRALSLFPDDTDLPLLAAAVYSDQGKTRQALALLDSALARPDLEPQHRSELMTSRGDILYKAGDLDSAFACYDRAIELDPSNFLAMNNAAYFLACSDRDLDRAMALIEKAVLGRPDDPTTLDTQAWVLFKRGDYARAREVIDRTIQLSEEQGEELSAELLGHAGDIYFMAREPEKALDFWKKALELEPGNKLLKRKVKNKTYFYE